MSTNLLAVLVLGLTAAVVIAIFLVLWRERTSARESRIAIVSGVVLAAWAIVTTMLARRGFFQPPDPYSLPPIGITLVLVLLVLAVMPPRISIVASPSHESKEFDPSQPLATVGLVFLDAHGQPTDASAVGTAGGDWRRDRGCNGAVDRPTRRDASGQTASASSSIYAVWLIWLSPWDWAS